MLGRKKESFNVREELQKGRERGLAQGREKVMATKKEKDFWQGGENMHTLGTSCNRKGRESISIEGRDKHLNDIDLQRMRPTSSN